MDILDMNILDDTENGIPAEDEDMESYHSDVEPLMNEDGGDYEQDEAGDPEVTKQTIYSTASVRL